MALSPQALLAYAEQLLTPEAAVDVLLSCMDPQGHELEDNRTHWAAYRWARRKAKATGPEALAKFKVDWAAAKYSIE